MTTVSPTASGCLSGWQIGRLACGDGATTPTIEAHLATCAHCNEALASQRTDVAAARLEAVPRQLKRPTHAVKAATRRGRSLALTLMVTAACAAWIVIPQAAQSPAVTHIKGAASMVATVKREGAIVADEMAMERLQDLQNNDHMRLRVLAEQGRYIDLATSTDRDAWNPVYQGELGADKWLPVGLLLDTSTPTYFRLRVCRAADDLAHCDEHIYKL